MTTFRFGLTFLYNEHAILRSMEEMAKSRAQPAKLTLLAPWVLESYIKVFTLLCGLCEICSKLTIETPERRQWTTIVDFKHISRLGLLIILLILSR